MEAKLLAAAEGLPQPGLDFLAIEEAAKKMGKPRRSGRRLFRMGVALVLVLCLATTVYAYSGIKYGLWSGLHSYGYGDVVLLNRRFDYTFPEEFCGLPFESMSIYYGAPEGASHLEALLAPTYALHSVDYGSYDTTRIHISFGTTKLDTWKYHFNVGADGFCDYEGVEPGSQKTVEYGEYTLYLYTIGEYHTVRWEDTARSLVFSMRGYGPGTESQEDVVEYAKALIDLNA